MAERKAYEQTIKGKLEAIPLPDMEDAIWARIETQLDIDMPTDDGGGNTSSPDNPGGFGWLGSSALLIFVIALISLFINQKKNNTQSIPAPVENITISKDALPTTDQEQGLKENKKDPVLTPSVKAANEPPDDTSKNGIVTEQPIGVPTFADTTPSVARAPESNVTVQDTTLPKPKRRGVQGINDNDYRIVPAKRDSS